MCLLEYLFRRRQIYKSKIKFRIGEINLVFSLFRLSSLNRTKVPFTRFPLRAVLCVVSFAETQAHVIEFAVW